MRLKYRFLVEYTDGTTHQQTPEDNSKLEPGVRSEFYDVLHSGKTIRKFKITNHALLWPKWLQVDLENGQFSHSHNFKPGDMVKDGDSALPDRIPKREVIFFRQHQHDYSQATREQLDHRVTYFIGWQANVKGKNYKRIVGVK